MKIFAFNFCLELRLEEAQASFSWDRSDLPQRWESLRDEGPAFPNQVAYLDARPEHLPLLQTWLRDEALAQHRFRWVLLFQDEALLKQFQEEALRDFKRQAAAGGLVFDAEGRLLLILRHGLWDLPKGKVEAGESLETAAVREVEEETGLDAPHLQKHFQDTFHVFQGRAKWRFKTTHWYGMHHPEPNPLTPQLEEAITEVRWWTREELLELPPTYPLIEDLIREVLGQSPQP